mgnify:CR=1 FL=1
MRNPAANDFDVPAFTPVALTRTRHNGWTPDRQRAFIAALVRTGRVSRAADAVGISVASAYNLRRRPDARSFAAAWERALDWASDRALDEAVARAIHGITFARTYRGRFIGTRHRRDDRDMIQALRLTDPVRFG